MAAPPKTKTSTPRLSEAARHLVYPPDIRTSGWPRIKRRLAEMAVEFDPWQEGAAKLVLGKRADGKYAATVGGVVWSIPRQVGKTFTIGSLLIAMCIEFPGLKVLWTAHRTRTATDAFRSMQAMVKRKRVKPHLMPGRNDGIRRANGEQEIAFRNGSMIMFGAREQGFGRGFAEIDVEVFDEAQILGTKALEDMVAATNQARHIHGALLFFLGTPPRPEDPSEAFREKRAKALAGKTKNLIYIEFSADPDSDPDDRKQWPVMNPSYPKRTPVESMERLRENLPGDESWNREGRGIWNELAATPSIVTAEAWKRRAAKTPPAQDETPTALGLDRWYDGSTSVAAAWRDETGTHVELVAVDVTPNTTAVVDWVAERAGKSIPVVIASDSPAAALVPDLQERKVKVRVIAAANYGKACVGFVDDVEDGRLTHDDQEPLNVALQGATKTDIGRAGAWGWDRRSREIDISPLVAVTLARFGAINTKKRSGEAVFA